MTFNPFKTTSSSSSKSSPHNRQQHDVPADDSWHSQPQPAPSSGPLSWFSSGWTSSATTFPPPIISQSMPTDENTRQTSASLATRASPAQSMIMLRASHSEGDIYATNNISTVTSNERTNGSNLDRTIVKNDGGNDLPSYPEPNMQQQQQRNEQLMNRQSDETNKQLLEAFPPKANRSLLEEFPSKQNKNKATDATNNTAAARKRGVPCYTGEPEEAYPGFALYQTARVQYCLGKYSDALDTTTECLAFQKLALGGSRVSTTSPMLGPQSISTNDDNSNNGMTALDLRSTFVTGVGRSMRGVVQSMKTSTTTTSGTSAQKQQSSSRSSPHPMLSNSMASMIAQYPLNPCIAQTLLFRGRVLVDCGLYGLRDGDDEICDGDTDFSLLLQAIRNIEIAVAILRKIDQEYDLATSLALLGTLRTLLGHFDEADRAYVEALSIFRGLRLASKYDQSHAIDEETTNMCDETIKRINDGMANVFYLQGKLFQTRRMHKEAFGCYRKSLILSKNNGAMRQDGCVKRLARCMKNKSALEKLVSAYIDDRCGV